MGDRDTSPIPRRPTLSGARAKLKRAKEHFNALQCEIDAIFGLDPYRVIAERPGKEPKWVIRVVEAPELPSERWALLVGDCVHNLRCALDYVAWELAGGRMDDTDTQFPIFLTRAGWSQKWKRRIGSVPPPVRTVIESLQPFQTENPRSHFLWAINTLDNADKHKLLTVVAIEKYPRVNVFSEPFNLSGPNPIIESLRMPLTRDAVVAHVTLRGAGPEVNMEAHVAPQIFFGEGLDFEPAGDLLGSLAFLIRGVEGIVDRFGHEFFGAS